MESKSQKNPRRRAKATIRPVGSDEQALMSDLCGGCLCGAIQLKVRLPQPVSNYRPRECCCDFCRKHKLLYISDPQGACEILARSTECIKRVKQSADGLAEFFFCSQCDSALGVGYESVGAVNAGLFIDVSWGNLPLIVTPAQLDQNARIARWRALWFSDFRLPSDTDFVEFQTDHLLSKWGFQDGELLDSLYPGPTAGNEFSRWVLCEVVEYFVCPKICNAIKPYRAQTSHNPARVYEVDGTHMSDLTDATLLKPTQIRVNREDILATGRYLSSLLTDGEDIDCTIRSPRCLALFKAKGWD